MMEQIIVENQNVLHMPCDILVLKYSQGFHGADLAVAKALGFLERKDDALAPGRYMRIPTKDVIPAKRVLFIGVKPLWDFSYKDIRRFARDALSILSREDCERDKVAMTIHGVGYGLDEKEAFTAQIAGLMEYLVSPDNIWRPKQIVIVDWNTNRFERLKVLLNTILAKEGTLLRLPPQHDMIESLPDAGIASDSKKHIFVAMPYDEDMEDVYEFGIKEPINAAGCLCERCDRSIFTGDILERIKHRIATATVVLADVTGANPNVYLEVGYAWGKSVPTLLVAREGEELHFDVKTHKCIYYKNILHLRKQLADLIPKLTS